MLRKLTPEGFFCFEIPDFYNSKFSHSRLSSFTAVCGEEQISFEKRLIHEAILSKKSSLKDSLLVRYFNLDHNISLI